MMNLVNRMMTEAKDAVIDMQGRIGIRQEGGYVTMTMVEGEPELDVVPFTSFAMTAPMFACHTPLDQIKPGMMIMDGTGRLCWAIKEPTERTIRVIYPSGRASTLTPARMTMMGQGVGLRVVGNPMMGGAGFNPALLMMAEMMGRQKKPRKRVLDGKKGRVL